MMAWFPFLFSGISGTNGWLTVIQLCKRTSKMYVVLGGGEVWIDCSKEVVTLLKPEINLYGDALVDFVNTRVQLPWP